MKITLQFLLFFICFSFCYQTNAQTTYYVDQENGRDTNSGTSLATAYKSFEQAKGQVNPGDTIEIIGEYTNPSYNPNYTYPTDPDPKVNAADAHLWHAENTIRINNLNGSSGNYITIKAHNSNTVLKGDGANIVRVTNSSYLRFEDLTIEGEVTRIPLSEANALQFVYVLGSSITNPSSSDINFRNEDETNDNDNVVEESDTYTSLGSVTRPSYIDTRGMYFSNSENITIKNNTIHHTPGGGLRVSDGKFVDILENEISYCSAKSYSGTHALVVTKTEPIGSSGYSINILRNKVHHNFNEQFSWAPTKTIITPRIDEGKGISLQRNNTTAWINGSGRILVANNLCYWNGFSGVHSNDGYRIDFINNTCYMNSYTNSIEPYGPSGSQSGEGQSGGNIGISTGGTCDDIKYINNISVVDTNWNGKALAATGNTTNLVVTDNLIFGINGSVSQDPDVTAVEVNTIISNPLFVDASGFDFSLMQTSPAIGIANTTYAPSDDFFGETRDANPDLGAIEYTSTLSTNNSSINNVAVFPNPFVDQITISQNKLDVKDIIIYDVFGKKQSFNYDTNENSITLKLNNLPSGLYLLHIGSTTKKILKKSF